MEWLRVHMAKKPGQGIADSQKNTGNEQVAKDDENRPDSFSNINDKDTNKSPEEWIRETGRLFIRNLPYTATEDDLRKYFEPYGHLSEVHMPISRETKKPKGFAYVMYMMPEHAAKAYKECDNKYLQGRLLHIIPGDDKPQSKESKEGFVSSDPRLGFMSNVKSQREIKKRANATSDFNWNSLYMSTDAVADSIANRLSIAKADLLENEEGSINPAVRLALAETHIIAETKQYFEENGIRLDAFEGMDKKIGGYRSDTVILVKNIPFGTTEEILRELFGKHGTLGRVLVPPSGTIAVVEFFEPSEARSAFRHLAYKRLKDAPIYLEKAPDGLFKTEAVMSTASDGGESKGAKDIDAILEPSAVDSTGKSADDYTEGVAGSVLFVKNLHFDTTESTLQNLFSGVDGLRSVVIRKKKNPKISGQMLSMGFGFVEYNAKEQAKQALRAYQGANVDGHSLQIKISDRTSIRGPGDSSVSTDTATSSLAKAKSAKLVVKNVAFEATRTDIRDLFAPFGQLKSVRLPKKFSGGHRGFAFVEFLTPQVALRVKEQMKDTHLYGRHLVVDWEEDNSASLDDLRAKVTKQYRQEELFNQSSQKSNKRARLELEAGGGSSNDMNEE